MAYGSKPSNMASMFNKEEEVKQEQVAAPQQEPVKEAPAEPSQNSIYDYLATIGGPSKQVVEQWKIAFGSVNLLPINDETVFIYRSLKRAEWNAMKAQFMQAGDSMTEDQKKDQIVSKCLLWPRIDPTEFTLVEAGLIDTLYTAIETSSYFLAPQVVMNMIMRL